MSIRKIVEFLTVDKSYVFEGDRNDFFKNLSNQKSINYEVVTYDEIVLPPYVSYSTILIGSYGFGISVQAFLTKIDEIQLKINFKTKIRAEHYVIAAIIIGFYAILPMFEKPN